MFDDRLKIALNVSNKIVTQGIVPEDLYMQALSRNPTIPVYNADGSYYENSNGANPAGLLKEQSTENKYDQLMMSGRISVEPIKDLTISATGIYMGDFNDYAYSTTRKHYSSTMGSTRGQARLSGATARTRHLNYRPIIRVNSVFIRCRRPSDTVTTIIFISLPRCMLMISRSMDSAPGISVRRIRRSMVFRN